MYENNDFQFLFNQSIFHVRQKSPKEEPFVIAGAHVTGSYYGKIFTGQILSLKPNQQHQNNVV